MSDPPDLEQPSPTTCDTAPPGPESPAGAAVRAAISDGARRLIAAAPEALQGVVEGVHQTRVATRRLRSDLWTFRALLDPSWAAPLRDELRWLGRTLGDVRELDVMLARLDKAAGEDREALSPVFDRLGKQHAEARARLNDALTGERFAELKGRLIEASRQPVLVGDHAAPCHVVLPTLVASAWKKLARRGRVLREHDDEEDFHEVRIRAKRARYAAEAVAPALDPEASKAAAKFARAARKLQDLLGEHQDAVVAGSTVARLAAEAGAAGGELPRGFRDAANRLVRSQDRAARKAARRFARAWGRIDRAKRLGWMRGEGGRPLAS